MFGKLMNTLHLINSHPILRERVHYLPDYDEELGLGLSLGANSSINTPIVGLEACGTSWMKDIANMGLLISTHDGGVADVSAENYLNVYGTNELEELTELYRRMEEAISIWDNDFDLEFIVQKQLRAYLPILSGARMLKDYLSCLFGDVDFFKEPLDEQ